MAKPHAVIFIVADEKYNAGERDYTKALVGQLKRQGLREDTDYLFYKVQPKDKNEAATAGGDPRVLPENDAQYKNVPVIGTAALVEPRAAQSVTIVGAGHSTLKDVAELASYFRQTGKAVEASYVTHIVEAAPELKTIADNGIRLFAATTPEQLAAVDAGLAGQVAFTALDAVPNTNSEEFCREHLARYNGGAKAVADSGQPFAFAVLNAGFEVGEPKVYTPYTVEEAAAHGAALGKYLQAGTALILAHGGPRNQRDEGSVRKPEDTHAAQDTTTAFTEAYKAAQAAKGAEPEIVVERFAQGMAYDAIKVGYLLGRAPNCVFWISNDEGFGTKSAACGHIDNRAKKLGSFQFAAEYADVTGARQASIEEWHKKGVSKLSVENGTLVITRHPQEESSVPAEDSAPVIVNALRLGKAPAAAPATTPAAALKRA